MNETFSLNDAKGFTLIELIITLVLLSFTLALLIPFFQAVGRSSDPIVRERTMALGQSLMDEILSRRWDENTPVGGGPVCSGEGGTGRGTTVYGTPLDCTSPGGLVASAIGDDGAGSRMVYNDIDDYDSMAPETDNFLDQAGVTFTYDGYGRSVQVDYVPSFLATVDKNTPSAAGTTDTKRVRVTVTNPLGESYVFVALACNF